MWNNYDYRKHKMLCQEEPNTHPRRAEAVAPETQRTRRATNDVSYLEKVRAKAYGE